MQGDDLAAPEVGRHELELEFWPSLCRFARPWTCCGRCNRVASARCAASCVSGSVAADNGKDVRHEHGAVGLGLARMLNALDLGPLRREETLIACEIKEFV